MFVDHVLTQFHKPVIVILNKVDLVPQFAVDAWTQYVKSEYGSKVVVLPFTCSPNPTGVTASANDDIAKRRKGKSNSNGVLLMKKKEKREKPVYVSRHAGQGDLKGGSSSSDELSYKGQDKVKHEEDEKKSLEAHIEQEKKKVSLYIDAVINVARTLSGPDCQGVRLAMVGQPNVGKSSIINAICGIKKVSVSATPGHTKSVHTIVMEDGNTQLLDCPGLIFPVCNLPRCVALVCGIFPYAQNREHFSAVGYLAERLPLEKIYGLTKIYDDDARWSPFEISEAVAVVKGFYLSRGKGRPDAHRGAQSILVDAFTGRLVLYYLP
jgi:ribosome biogenesis GTPase A